MSHNIYQFKQSTGNTSTILFEVGYPQYMSSTHGDSFDGVKIISVFHFATARAVERAAARKLINTVANFVQAQAARIFGSSSSALRSLW